MIKIDLVFSRKAIIRRTKKVPPTAGPPCARSGQRLGSVVELGYLSKTKGSCLTWHGLFEVRSRSRLFPVGPHPAQTKSGIDAKSGILV